MSITTLEDVLHELGIDFKRAGESKHVTEGWYGIVCPYCGVGSGNYGMGVRQFGDWLRATCWKCGPHSVLKALNDAASRFPDPAQPAGSGVLGSFSKPLESRRNGFLAIRELLRRLTQKTRQNARESPLRANAENALKPPIGIEPLNRRVFRDFIFEKWGLDPDYLSEVWGVRAVGPDGESRYAWSLYIPVMDDSGTVVSWVCRFIEQSCTGVKASNVRYAAAPKDRETVNHKTLLYGSHLAGHAIVVGEGCPDAWAVGPGGCGLFGTGWKPQQVAAIAKFPVRVIVTDSDSKESIKRGEKLSEELMVHPGETIRVQLESGKDPSRASRKELNQLRGLLK